MLWVNVTKIVLIYSLDALGIGILPSEITIFQVRQGLIDRDDSYCGPDLYRGKAIWTTQICRGRGSKLRFR